MDRFKAMHNFLEEHAREGRDVQLYAINGQTVFPQFSLSSALRTDIAVFPILRGIGERAPKFEGSFPTKDGETVDIGNGWIVMCVLFRYDDTAAEWIKKLESGEEELRKMKSGR
jgi:hypothetical protein